MIDLNVQVSGQGPSLLLIHGWAMSDSVWDDCLDELEQHFQVICIDLPGHGQSDYQQLWTLDELLDAMAAQLPARCYVLGWSLGGMVGLAYASQYASRVNGLIMLASSAKFVQSASWPHAQPPATLRAFSKGLQENPTATLKRFVMLQTQGLDSPRATHSALKAHMNQFNIKQLPALASGLNLLEQLDLRQQLSGLACPLLMIIGDNDQLIPVEVGQDSIQHQKNTVLHVVKGASHVPFISHKEETLQQVFSFVDSKVGM